MSVKLTELREPLLDAREPRLEAREPLLLPDDIVRVLADRLHQAKEKETKKMPSKYNQKHRHRHKYIRPFSISNFICIQHMTQGDDLAV